MSNDALKNLSVRLATVRGFFGYLWRNRLWWLIPIVVVMLLFGAAVLVGQSTPLGPFIYTLF